MNTKTRTTARKAKSERDKAEARIAELRDEVTKTKKGPAEPFRLEIIYSWNDYPEDRDIDGELEKIVGRLSDASGAGFGERDNAWYFKTKKEADAASARIGRKLRKVRKSVKDIRDDEWYDEDDW